MGNINVAVVGGKDFAPSVGKKGTVTDVTFYEIKKGDDSVTLIEPSKYPDKLSSLFYSVGMAEYAVLVVDAIDSHLGETIVMVDAMGLDKGWIVLRNFIQKEQLAPLLADTCLTGYEYIEDDAVKTREMLISFAGTRTKVPGEGTCGSCPVDSHFNVKGVGTVVLGSVIDGYFRKHDKMRVLPLNKEVVLKSIQKHDLDSDFAYEGDHVGLALRGIDSDELDRGYVLTTDASVKMSKTVSGKARMVKFWPSPVKEGMVFHVGHWMQMVPGRVESSSGDAKSPDLRIVLDNQIIHRPGDKALMMYLEGGKLRVMGSILLE